VLAKVLLYTYGTELLPTMMYHNVYHVSLLEPGANNAYLGQWPNPPLPVEIHGEDEYFIEAIWDS
jgi:hypothetical protein